MQRSYYSNAMPFFINDSVESILGTLTTHSDFAVEPTQRDAWVTQITTLQSLLIDVPGWIYFEYGIPRMGKRVDVIIVSDHAIYVIEYKVGEKHFTTAATDQVTDYGLDLKNFHETSHDCFVVPILIATEAPPTANQFSLSAHRRRLFPVIETNGNDLAGIIQNVESSINQLDPPEPLIDVEHWENGSYRPTPTIIEAALALYNGHGVADISRSDASGVSLHRTTETISEVIADAKANSKKAICFVTGVPGAGKTLIGLNVATQHFDKDNDLYSVYLSGNGPLVKILQEALAIDKVQREAQAGRTFRKGEARSEVKMFIQNVHHYRDECIIDPKPPVGHIALFDEAQRAWTLHQTSTFMKQKKNLPDFNKSEPEFLLSCIDRHDDWGVVVCLVGGGQEINTGEAGITEWITALIRSFPEWHIHVSDRLEDDEFGAGDVLRSITSRENVHHNPNLHLAVSMRSFRAENVSLLVKQILDLDQSEARNTLAELHDRYPIVLTRDLDKAKSWLRQMAQGTERYGIVVSSKANRLKPLAIDVRLQPNPIHWFLADKSDIRSSYQLEDVATEFDIQGLELDWACVTWDADFRFTESGWKHHSFRGSRWVNINQRDRQTYLKNAYRVLLTRARQGMVIVVPEGDLNDPTRLPSLYDPTFEYLKELDLEIL
jgi:hypothetical protein